MIKKSLLIIFLCFVLIISCKFRTSNKEIHYQSFTVMVVSPGNFNDNSTNQRCFEAMQRICEKQKIRLIYNENVANSDLETLISNYSDQSVDLLLAWEGS